MRISDWSSDVCSSDLPYQSGSVMFEGKEVGARTTDLPKLRSRIGMVFQSFELYPHMTAVKNVMLAQVQVLKRSRAQARERSLEQIGKASRRERVWKYV